MICGGVSLQGSYHDINQDNFAAEKFDGGYVLVVSDGLGSRMNSQTGSRMVCKSVLQAVNAENSKEILDDCQKFIETIHKNWLSSLGDYCVEQCYATVLCCIVTSEKIIALRLGDGFLAYVTAAGPKVLFDAKEEYFANQTDCMMEELNLQYWEYTEDSADGFIGAIACTDGLEIDPLNEEGLVIGMAWSRR